MMCAANLAGSSFYHQEQVKPRHEPPADPTTSKQPLPSAATRSDTPKACSDSRDEVNPKVVYTMSRYFPLPSHCTFPYTSEHFAEWEMDDWVACHEQGRRVPSVPGAMGAASKCSIARL